METTPTPQNIATDGFRLHPEDEAAMRAEASHYEQPQAACIEALKMVQRRHGWVPDEAIPAIARVLGVGPVMPAPAFWSRPSPFSRCAACAACR